MDEANDALHGHFASDLPGFDQHCVKRGSFDFAGTERIEAI
jgi:hypothetical protein